MENEVKQFDSISDKYASFVDIDPIRNFLHYPSVIETLGMLKNKKILDIGCGDGLFDRELAKKFGAKITGYDKAQDLIKIAQKIESDEFSGITYSVDDPISFIGSAVFDDSLSVMVLPYSPNKDYLVNFFISAYKNIKNGGKFVSVIFNPRFTEFSEVIANRVFKLKGGKIEVNFLNPQNGEVKFTAVLMQYSVDDYEGGARKAGFEKISWKDLYPTKEGADICGESFWESCIKEQPYALLVVEK